MDTHTDTICTPHYISALAVRGKLLYARARAYRSFSKTSPASRFMTKFCSGGIDIESWSSIGTYEPHSAWRNRAAQQSVQTITVPQDTMPYDTMPHGITVPTG